MEDKMLDHAVLATTEGYSTCRFYTKLFDEDLFYLPQTRVEFARHFFQLVGELPKDPAGPLHGASGGSMSDLIQSNRSSSLAN